MVHHPREDTHGSGNFKIRADRSRNLETPRRDLENPGFNLTLSVELVLIGLDGMLGVGYSCLVMKIQIGFSHLPTIIIDCNPDECARLLGLLGHGVSPDIANNPPDIPDTEESRPTVVQPHWGQRRQMVLQVFFSLYEKGKVMIQLNQIEEVFVQLFPREDTQNLAQVVRDLANKTNLVERCERGTFRLTDAGIEQFK